MGSPSSRMNPAESATGRAPHIARSLTVPCTASEPMSPPGKNNGLMTNESVENASRSAGRVEQRAVVQRLQHRVGEGRHDHALDEHLRQPAAAAMRQRDRRVVRNRDRALQRKDRGILRL